VFSLLALISRLSASSRNSATALASPAGASRGGIEERRLV
jgi:hypothetical protein